MLQKCLPSVSTLAAMLNSYASVPPCHWLDSLSPELYQVSVTRLLGSSAPRSTSPLLISSASSPSGAPSLLGLAASAQRPAQLAAASLSPLPARAPGGALPLGARRSGHSQLRQGISAAVPRRLPPLIAQYFMFQSAVDCWCLSWLLGPEAP